MHELVGLTLPKRDELLFLSVFALPKASSTGFDCSRRSLMLTSDAADSASPDAAAMYSMMRLAASVFPAPDSPETRMH